MARYRKLGRTSSHRDLMLRNLTTSLLEKGRIETTETRAKEARRQVEKNDHSSEAWRSACTSSSCCLCDEPSCCSVAVQRNRT